MKIFRPALAVLLIIGSLFTAAYAEADYENAREAREIFENIGMELPEKDFGDTVTRLEYVKLIAGLLNAPEMPQGGSPYTDITADTAGAGAVFYAYNAGYIAGDTAFRPKEEITVNDACAIAVRVIGREAYAISGGGYPAGYNRAAAQYGLTKNLTDTADGKLCWADALVLLRNIAENDAVVVSSISGDKIEYKYEKDFFEVYYDVYELTGIVTEDTNGALYAGSYAVGKGKVGIDGKQYCGGADLKLGDRVRGFVREVDGDWYIISVKPYKNSKLSIDFSDLKDAADGKITYEKDSRRKNATIDTGDYAVLYNGKAAKSKTPADFVGKSNGRLELTDNDGDGRYEVISIFEYRVTVVSTASKTDKIITDQNADSVLRLSASDIVCNIYENGSASDFDAITEGKFLISYLSEDGLLCNIYVYSDTVEAAVAGVDKADKKIILDETEYDYDEYFEMYYLEQLVLGQKSEFYVADGRIYACVLDRSTEMLYGYIVRVRKFDGENGETVRFKIFNEDGKLDNYDAAEKVKIDDKMRKESDVIYDYFTSEGVTNRQLVRYKLNKDGEISVIDTCNSAGRLDSSAKDTNNLTRYKFPRAVATSLWYIDTNKSFHPYFRIADDTKIFMVADGKVADEKRCAIKDADYFKANRSQKSAALNIYNLTELGVAGAIVIVDSSAITPTVADDAPVGIVYRVAKTIDSDDNLTYRFSIFRDGEFSHFFVAEDAIERIAPGGICKADKGDAVRYSLDNDGNINALEKDYDASEDAITKPFPDNGTGTHTSKGVNYFGMVYDVSGTDITIVPQGVPGIAYDPQDKDSRFSMGLASCKIYVVSEDCERIYEGSANDIMTYRNSGSSCNRVLISVNDGVAQSVIVYK